MFQRTLARSLLDKWQMTIILKSVFERSFLPLKKKTCLDQNHITVTTPSSVISVVLDFDDNLILVRQFRENLSKYTLEFPAGGVEPGESPHDAVVREVYEEAGIKISAKYIGRGFILMDRCKNPDYLFLDTKQGSKNIWTLWRLTLSLVL